MAEPYFFVKVLLLAFGQPGETRLVCLPIACKDLTDNELLEKVYYYGQNEFQSLKHPSVSSGDVVLLGGIPWRCEFAGWKQLTNEQLNTYMDLPREKRQFYRFEEASA